MDNTFPPEIRFYVSLDGVPGTPKLKAGDVLLKGAVRLKQENPDALVALHVTFED